MKEKEQMDGYVSIFQCPIQKAWKRLTSPARQQPPKPLDLTESQLTIRERYLSLDTTIAQDLLDANKNVVARVRNEFTWAAFYAALPVLAMNIAYPQFWSHASLFPRLMLVGLGLCAYLYKTVEIRGYYQRIKKCMLEAMPYCREFPDYASTVEGITGREQVEQGLGYINTCLILNEYVNIVAAAITSVYAVLHPPDVVLATVVGTLIALRILHGSDFSVLVNVISVECARTGTLWALRPWAVLAALNERYSEDLLGEIRRVDFLKSTILAIAGPLGVWMSVSQTWGCLATIALVWAIGYVIVPLEIKLAVLLSMLCRYGRHQAKASQ